MNLVVVGYLIYLPVTLLLTFWVAKTLFKIAGFLCSIFLEDVLK